MWQIEDSGGRPTTEADDNTENEKIDAPVDTYTIRGLKSNTVYHITVTVHNPAGGSMTSPSINVTTEMGNNYTVTSTHIVPQKTFMY